MGYLPGTSFQQKGISYQNINITMKNTELNSKAKRVINSSQESSGAERVHHKKLIQNTIADQPDSTIPIGVIELRNYVIKHGQRDRFINYFEENLIESQIALKGYVVGQYRVKGSEDNFCWIRGFKNMKERSSFLPAFYYGDTWKKHRNMANSMLVNNDNVYLLRPLLVRGDSLEPAKSINHSLLIPKKGLAVVNFYIANTKLDQLLNLFAKKYLPLQKACDINDCTLWTSVLEENDFPKLPVFQDNNLLVTITFYKNLLEYKKKMKMIDSAMSDDLRASLQDVITIKNTMILYPSVKTINQQKNPCMRK